MCGCVVFIVGEILDIRFGTPVLNNCLTINNMGNVNIPYDTKPPEVIVDRIKASTLEYITIDDNVTSTGNLVVNGSSNYKPCWVAGKVDGKQP